MSCERFREAIAGDAAGGDVSGAAAAHIACCESCRAAVERRRVLLAEVDAEFARTLAMTASPQFVARVTAQAAAAAAPGWTPWRPALAGIGLAAAAAIALLSWARAPAPAVSPVPRDSAVAVPAPAPAPAIAAISTPRQIDRPPAVRRSRPRPPRQQAAAPSIQDPAPSVIVGPEQIRAISRLRELLREGRLTAKMLPPEPTHGAVELTVAPLQIPEITVPEIESLGRPLGSFVEQEPEEH